LPNGILGPFSKISILLSRRRNGWKREKEIDEKVFKISVKFLDETVIVMMAVQNGSLQEAWQPFLIVTLSEAKGTM